MQGRFITIEGPEGAGKTTVAKRLADILEQSGREVVLTREPGGIRIAEQIRHIILNPENTEMDPRTEALLYAAARGQHLHEKVIPALERGALVICDRFIDSSLAYQGYARELGIDEVWNINKFAIQDIVPDLTLYFDIDPVLGLQRIEKHSGREVNRLDLENIEFHKRVRAGYRLLLDRFPERIVEVHAGEPVEVVLKQSETILSEAIARWEAGN